MTVFLTPDRRAVLRRHVLPARGRGTGCRASARCSLGVADAYRERRDDVERRRRTLLEAIRREASEIAAASDPLAETLLDEARRRLRASVRSRRTAASGGAPKFPPASALEFLPARAATETRRSMVERTLDAMAEGGMYDHVGGGFHRYSIDERWLVPHFEKMLYDNALLISAYLHGWLVLGKERYRAVVEETVDYVLRDLALPEGGFASAQDADTEGVEGLTYTWTEDDDIPAELLQPFEHGQMILRGTLDPVLWARLTAERAKRPQPELDDKAIASWNGLALAALAEAGRHFGRIGWIEAAERLAAFLLGPLSTADGRLRRTWRDGRSKGTGYLDDYANVAHGLYELHVATGDLRWLEESLRLTRLAVELFGDSEHGGFFMTPADGEELVMRKKELDDHPIPSGNAMMAFVLLRLARIYGDEEMEKQAVSVFRLLQQALRRSPGSFAWALCALDLHFAPPREIAIVGPPSSAVARKALEGFDPNAVVAFGPAEGVPLLAGKDFVDGKPAVYVCERFACRAPVTDPADLA